jgi:uncharacterized protein (TIGR02145 family)/uncharacterized repeat protein (TIGR02543 family)
MMKKSILMITLAVTAVSLFVTCNDRGTDVDSDRWDGKVDKFLRTFGDTAQQVTPPGPGDATSYTLTVSADPPAGGTVTRIPDKDVYNANENVTVMATPYKHYTFIGWSGMSSSTSETVSITMNGNKELIAYFTINKYKLTTEVSVAVGGTVTRNPEKDAYTAGDTVTVTATAAPNYTFNGWSGASSSTDSTVKIVMDGPKALTADFGKNGASRFTVYFNRNSATGNAVESTTADSGSSITLPDQQTMEKAGYQFGGWSTNSTGTGTNYPAKSSYAVTQNDIMLYARWVPVHTVTFNPMGGTVASTSGTTDTTGKLTTSLPVPTKNGYRFDGWFTTETTGGTLVTMSYTFKADAAIYARWTATSGMFTDSRGNKSYKWVEIGGKKWMAENLNYDTLDGKGSWCYDNKPDSCGRYGRLYNWNTAMAGSPSSTSRVRGVCPSGWHLPSHQEWEELLIAAGDNAVDKLKAKTGWKNRSNEDSGNGTDDFGFSALPGGGRYTDGTFYGAGYNGYWWTATEDSDGYAYYRSMYYNYVNVDENGNGNGVSVRCVQD